MSFVETERTAMDAELARQTLLRLKFEDEARRQTEIRIKIEEEAARAADKAIIGHLYETTEKEISLHEQLSAIDRNIPPKVKAAAIEINHLLTIQRSYNHQRFTTQLEKDHLQGRIDAQRKIVSDMKDEINKELKIIQENKREEIRLQFIITATERERAIRLEETNAALETIRQVEAAQEAERLRMIQEESEQRELEFAEYTARMAAVAAEQQEALRLAELNRQIGLNAVTPEGDKTFKVEVPQPVMASMSIPTPMLLVGGAAAFLLLARRK